MKVGFMFPGQGSQYVGMGKEFYDNFPVAKGVYKQANDVLGYDITKLCFFGPEEELVQTKYSQPAILVASIACLRVLQEKLVDLRPYAVGGLSLGEYTALVCAESLNFSDALRLVQKRAEFMQEVSTQCNGGMASVLGVNEKDVRKVIGNKVDVANLNCPGQVVVSGLIDNIEEVKPLFKKVIPLKVSGPFHSRYMEPAKVKLEPLVLETNINEPKMAFMANVTGDSVSDPSRVKQYLIKQVSSSVYWEKCVKNMLSIGIEVLIEIGPGKVLGGLLRKIDKDIRYFNVEDLTSLQTTIEGVSYAKG